MITFLVISLVYFVGYAGVLSWKLDRAKRHIAKRERYIAELIATLQHHGHDVSHHQHRRMS